MKLIPFCVLLASPLLSHAAIFGTDTRTYANAGSPMYREARATAIAVLSSFYTEVSPGVLKIQADSMSGQVCTDEKFAADPSLNYSCTGFLVAPDLIATAGHCMVNVGEAQHETDTYCAAYSWLFDYSEPVSGTLALGSIPSANLYHCKQVVYAVVDEAAPFRDYALVQLDHPVTDRSPLKIASTPVSSTDTLSMLGYPLGTPVKLSRNGKILLDNPERQSFITNLDAFDGNSGSPVLNQAHEVVGILVGGTPTESFFQDNLAHCPRYNRCDGNGENCSLPDKDNSVFPGFQRVGSEVQRIAPLVDWMKAI